MRATLLRLLAVLVLLGHWPISASPQTVTAYLPPDPAGNKAVVVDRVFLNLTEKMHENEYIDPQTGIVSYEYTVRPADMQDDLVYAVLYRTGNSGTVSIYKGLYDGKSRKRTWMKVHDWKLTRNGAPFAVKPTAVLESFYDGYRPGSSSRSEVKGTVHFSLIQEGAWPPISLDYQVSSGNITETANYRAPDTAPSAKPIDGGNIVPEIDVDALPPPGQ